MNSFTSLKKTTLEQADRCVKCGLCSAQCPTYRLNGSENESPRGRIALTQALASGQLTDTTAVEEHINNCLTCQRCEKVCPSGVDFGSIISNSRTLLANKQSPKYATAIKWSSKRTHKDWMRIATITGILKKTGILRLAPALSTVYPHLSAPSLYRRPINAKCDSRKQNTVSLFTGCTSHILDAENLDNAVKLLTLSGYEVSIPTNQVCCGALPLHKGLLDSAKQCKKSNIAAFDSDTPIIFLATACGAALKAYGDDAFRSQVSNITTFLNDQNALAKLSFKPLNKHVLIHDPCSEKNALKATGQTQKLLENIPDIEIMSLKETTGCCGAAGDYMIMHKEKANQIREALIQDIEAIKPDIIVTTNYTCGIHIKNGLQARSLSEKHLDIPVVHPIKLLLDQLI